MNEIDWRALEARLIEARGSTIVFWELSDWVVVSLSNVESSSPHWKALATWGCDKNPTSRAVFTGQSDLELFSKFYAVQPAQDIQARLDYKEVEEQRDPDRKTTTDSMPQIGTS